MMRFTAQSGYLTALNLFILDENVFEQCTNLFGVVKLILLKISVGAIVVQGLIESFLYTSGTSPFKDDDTYDSEEKTLRAYCQFGSAHKFLCSSRAGFVWNRLRSAFLPTAIPFSPAWGYFSPLVFIALQACWCWENSCSCPSCTTTRLAGR